MAAHGRELIVIYLAFVFNQFKDYVLYADSEHKYIADHIGSHARAIIREINPSLCVKHCLSV